MLERNEVDEEDEGDESAKQDFKFGDNIVTKLGEKLGITKFVTKCSGDPI